MFRTAIVAAVLVATGAFSAQAKMDCDAAYQNFWEKVTKAAVSLRPSDLAVVNEQGARGYQACQAGDEQSPKTWIAGFVDENGFTPDQNGFTPSEDGLSLEAYKVLQEAGFGK